MYCRVAACNKHIETEVTDAIDYRLITRFFVLMLLPFVCLQLTCISPHVKKEWVTGESIFGELLVPELGVGIKSFLKQPH
jgi:hypothetical protein